ncbi:hypothetical protein K3L72_10200 [Bacillus altitudinis]|uniref:Phage protein n=1 Tax=Bacillus altitudinis TaxID=293387 RepID=A0ABV1S2J8_BACAB|nr:hypothetical protein [Bacillus altitudinis]MBY0186476.1 hypothetical protein [Bacillus aerophilus]MCW4358152.1 hypothetical protein [Bacillus altitudinis]MCY7579350.1 hypothetical protein [Bacillus altitudinis]MCY7594661.1 hypothetical protein [Bacillus altitudinis]WJE31537.1 hypothetical protein QRD87_06570 [Bacillus altitudinis]
MKDIAPKLIVKILEITDEIKLDIKEIKSAMKTTEEITSTLKLIKEEHDRQLKTLDKIEGSLERIEKENQYKV